MDEAFLGLALARLHQMISTRGGGRAFKGGEEGEDEDVLQDEQNEMWDYGYL